MTLTRETAVEGAVIESKDGTRIFHRRWPVENSKANVLIIHGYAEHSGRYDHVAAFFNSMGFGVRAFDVRGHGRSSGVRGHTRRFSDYLDDAELMLDLIAREDGDPSPFILGHSHGGLIALSLAINREPKTRGLLVTSPFLGVAVKVAPAKLAVGRLLSAIYPSLSLSTGLPSGYLSHDQAVCSAYANDPLVFGTATARWYTEAMGAIDEVFRRAGELDLPLILLHAGDDRVADPSRAKPFFDAVGSRDKTYIDYPSFYHEVMNEEGKERVFADMREWILKRLG